ncbi:MAG: hypothetical protein ACRD6X_04780 [Pyrinomonadaceae bacterium]
MNLLRMEAIFVRYSYVSNFLLITAHVVCTTLSLLAQTKPAETAITPSPQTPGNIVLPSGYVYERRQGKDSRVGVFVRKDGFIISHDIGGMAANYADEYFPEHFERLRKQTHLNSNAIEGQIKFLQDRVEWRQRQKVNGSDVMVVMLKDSTLIACFVDSSANFIAKVDSTDKVADFFLIVLTYQPGFNNRI